MEQIFLINARELHCLTKLGSGAPLLNYIGKASIKKFRLQERVESIQCPAECADRGSDR